MYYQTDITKTPKEMLVELLNFDNGTDFTVETLKVHNDLNRVDALSEITIETLRPEDGTDIPTVKVNFRHVPLDGLFSEITVELKEVDIIDENRAVVAELVLEEFARKYGIYTSAEWFNVTGDFDTLTFEAKEDNYVYAGSIAIVVKPSLHRRVARTELGGFSIMKDEPFAGYADRAWLVSEAATMVDKSATLVELPDYGIQMVAPKAGSGYRLSKVLNRKHSGPSDGYRSFNQIGKGTPIRALFSTPMAVTGLLLKGIDEQTATGTFYLIKFIAVDGTVHTVEAQVLYHRSTTVMIDPIVVKEISVELKFTGHIGLSRMDIIKPLGQVDNSIELYEEYPDIKWAIPRLAKFTTVERNRVTYGTPEIVLAGGQAYGAGPSYGIVSALNRKCEGNTDGYLSQSTHGPESDTVTAFTSNVSIRGFILQGLRHDAFGMQECLVRLVDEDNNTVYEQEHLLPLRQITEVIFDAPITAKSVRVYSLTNTHHALGRFDVLLEHIA